MGISKKVVINKEGTNYQADGRAAAADLFQSFQKLEEAGWARAVIGKSEIEQSTVGRAKVLRSEGDEILSAVARMWLIVCWMTKQTGPAFWILSGVHGEEPAGPNALARNTAVLIELGKKVPVVLFPLLNPAGYARDWRYPNEYRDWQKGTSVNSAEHLLLDFNKPDHPQSRRVQPESKEAGAITSQVLELVKSYPPLLALDHHEDEALEYSYLYSQGPKGVEEPVAKEIIGILKNSGIPIQQQGETRFGEKVIGGVVQSVNDGSIDELLAADKIIVRGQVMAGPAAPISIVIETPVINVSLEKRIGAHQAVIQSYERLWALAKKYIHSG